MKFGTNAAAAALAGMMLLSATACSAMPPDPRSRSPKMPSENMQLQEDWDSRYRFGTPAEKNGHTAGKYTLYHRSGDRLYRYSPMADNKGNVRQNVTGLAKPAQRGPAPSKGERDRNKMSDDLRRDGRRMAEDARDAAKDTVDRAKEAGQDLGKDMKDMAADVWRTAKDARDRVMNPSGNDLGANRAPVMENGRSTSELS